MDQEPEKLDDEEPKKPPGLGLKKISMGDYQPPSAVSQEFEADTRQQIERSYHSGYRPKPRQ